MPPLVTTHFLPLGEHPRPEHHTAGAEIRTVRPAAPAHKTGSEFHFVEGRTLTPCPDKQNIINTNKTKKK